MYERQPVRNRSRSSREEHVPAESGDKFFRILQFQLVLCAVIVVAGLGIKTLSANLFSVVKVGTFSAINNISDFNDLNSKLDDIAADNNLLCYFLGRPHLVNAQPAPEDNENTTEETSGLPPIEESSLEGENLQMPEDGAGIVFAPMNISDSLFTPVFVPVVDAEDYNAVTEEDSVTASTVKIPALAPKELTMPEKISNPTKKGRITSPFGIRNDPFTGNASFHTGIDIGVASGTEVVSVMSGKVKKTGKSTVYGNYIIIEHSDNVLSMYAHLSKVLVKEGKSVKKDGKIALSGNTGRSTGPHLHFEIRLGDAYADPSDYVDY